MTALLALTAGWSVAEGLLFFLVADVPISWIAVRHGWRRGVAAALIAAPSAALGGLMMALWASRDAASAHAALVALPAIDKRLIGEVAIRWAEGGYLAMAKGAFTGTPYKLFAFAYSQEPQGELLLFLFGSIAARLPRFGLIALGASAISRVLGQWLNLKLRLMLLGLCWLAFYFWYFSTMPG
jgi:hypothetical protein